MLVKGGLHGSALVDTFGVRTPIFSEKSKKNINLRRTDSKSCQTYLSFSGIENPDKVSACDQRWADHSGTEVEMTLHVGWGQSKSPLSVRKYWGGVSMDMEQTKNIQLASFRLTSLASMIVPQERVRAFSEEI